MPSSNQKGFILIWKNKLEENLENTRRKYVNCNSEWIPCWQSVSRYNHQLLTKFISELSNSSPSIMTRYFQFSALTLKKTAGKVRTAWEQVRVWADLQRGTRLPRQEAGCSLPCPQIGVTYHGLTPGQLLCLLTPLLLHYSNTASGFPLLSCTNENSLKSPQKIPFVFSFFLFFWCGFANRKIITEGFTSNTCIVYLAKGHQGCEILC